MNRKYVIFSTYFLLLAGIAYCSQPSLPLSSLISFRNITENGTVNGTEVQKFTFKIIRFKDCNSTKDSFHVKQLVYPENVQIPGHIKFNGSGVVEKNLPNDWNIKYALKIKMPWVGWVNVPCFGSCEIRSICNKTILDECKISIARLNMDPEKVCRCDYEPGSYELPTINIPIDIPILRDEAIKDYMTTNARGREIRLDVTLRSASDSKRFGCLNGLLKML